jgi:hypothetical protein
LRKDKVQLEKNGYSNNRFHLEFTALLEVLVGDLYSSLDGIRRVLFSVYRDTKGIQNHSTETLFKRAIQHDYYNGIPPNIRDALVTAQNNWFPSLRRLRTELAHGQTGVCDLVERTDKIRYFHGGLGDGRKAFVIEDVIAELNTWREGVIVLKEIIFKQLFLLLEQEPVHQPCGMYKGHLYERFVAPTATLSSNDGFCHSRRWFLMAGDLQCPRRNECGAFNREWTGKTPW